MPRVLVFGTFDTYHKGHDFFLSEAAKLGELHVAVARDEHVRSLKQHDPSRKEAERMATIKRNPNVFAVHLSDNKLGTYEIVQTLKPDIIALGHDQHGLAVDLERWIKATGRWQGRVVQLKKL